jgi:hypothetical protein
MKMTSISQEHGTLEINLTQEMSEQIASLATGAMQQQPYAQFTNPLCAWHLAGGLQISQVNLYLSCQT